MHISVVTLVQVEPGGVSLRVQMTDAHPIEGTVHIPLQEGQHQWNVYGRCGYLEFCFRL